MGSIYKYKISLEAENLIEIPKEGKILSVQNQNDEITIWVEVDTTKEKEWVSFYVIGTGWHTSFDNIEYVGTVQMSNGLVWHVYKKKSV